MKKTLFITIIVFIISLTLQSQITEGNWMVGGSGSYTHISIDNNGGINNKTSTLSINPNIGYFLKDKFVTGSTLGYYRITAFESDSWSQNYSIGVFARYYFLKPEKTFNLFTQIYYNNVFSEAQNIAKRKSYNYGAKLGQTIFFNSSVGLEFTLEYGKRINESSKYNIFNVGLGFQIHLEK